MDSTPSHEDEDAGLDLVGLWRILWSYRWLLIACGLTGAAIAVVLALTAEPVFRSEVVVAEVRDNGINGGGALASQFGGLASLAGVNLFGNVQDDRNAAATLNSRFLAEQFIERYQLQPALNKYSQRPQSLWQTVEDFRGGVLVVREDKRTGLTTVGVDWTDAKLAARWANDYVALANEIIRKRALDESGRNVTYLNAQIAKTNVIELQRVMYSLIESETKNLMFANARTEYAFKVIDPAVAPLLKFKPKRTAMVIGGGVLGGCLGLMFIFVHRFALKVRKASRKS